MTRDRKIGAGLVSTIAALGAAMFLTQSGITTCGAAQSAIDAGGVVELATATFDCQLNVRRSVTLRAASGATPVMKGNQSMRGYPAVFVTTGGQDVVIGPGLTFTNPVGDGMKIDNSGPRVTVTGNVFRSNGMQGMLVQNTKDVRIERSEFVGNGADVTLDPHTTRPGTGLHGLYFGGGTAGSSSGQIVSNWFHDNLNGQTIQLGGNAKGVVVANNTIQRTNGSDTEARTCVGLFESGSQYSTEFVEVRNNICTDSAYGVAARAGRDRTPLGTSASNGFQNVTFKCQGCPGTPYGVRSNLLSTPGPDYSGPFSLATTGQPIPQTGSSAIGKSDPAYLPATDFNGSATSAKALGAFQPTGTPPPPADALPLTVIAETSSTITFGWTPPAGAFGYVFYVDGTRVSSTFDGTRSSAKFGKATSGTRTFKVTTLLAGPSGDETR